MNLTRTKAISKKEFIQIWRDPRSLAMAIGMPILLLIIFGYAITLDVNNIKMVVYDLDKSQVSRDFTDSFIKSGYFEIVKFTDSYDEVEKLIDNGSVRVGLVIPHKFSEDIKVGKQAKVQALLDGSDSNTAGISIGYISVVAQSYSIKIAAKRIGLNILKVPVDNRVRVWYNQDLVGKNYIVPGLIAVIMTMIAALITSLTVAREWERGTMEQLISTPVRTNELITGKLSPYFLIGIFDVAISVIVGLGVFRIPLRGNAFLLFLLAGIFLVGALSLGILISIVAKSQLVANQFALVATFLPAFLLSGFLFPVQNMPRILQYITYLVPAKYFIVISRGIFLKGNGLAVLMIDVMFLVIFGVVLFAIANLKLKKKLE